MLQGLADLGNAYLSFMNPMTLLYGLGGAFVGIVMGILPGLLPGLLGIAMILLGGVLALRSWQRGAFAQPRAPFTAHQREVRKRVWSVIALCCVYSVLLIGHGLPFWMASSIFIAGSILILQRMNRDPEERRLTPKWWGKALVIGVLASVITQAAFQDLFLVRLP